MRRMAMQDLLPDIRPDPDERARLPRKGSGGAALAFGVVMAAAVFGWFWWTQVPRETPPTTIAVAPSAPVPDVPPTAAQPTVQYPVEEPDAKPLKPGEVKGSLAELVGRTAAANLLQTDQFPRRLVATLDNLARPHAPLAAWPVMPTTGRFTVESRSGATVIAAANAARYNPFVSMATSVDAGKAAKLYRRMYPLLQQAYRELGYDRYLNDRVVQVIDTLLATPEPASPPRVRLTEVKGPIAMVRPWVHYRFEDPELENLGAGQKILLRVGVDHERRLKKKLAEFRSHLVGAGSPKVAR